MSTTRLREFDQILFTNSARNVTHLFQFNKKRNAAKRTNPYLSTTSKPQVHRFNQNGSAAAENANEGFSLRIYSLLIPALVWILAIRGGMQMNSFIITQVDANVSGTMEPRANNQFENAHAWAVPLGGFIAAAIVGIIGRRSTLLISLLPALIGCAITNAATSGVTIMIGQLLNGISLGMQCGPTLVYIGECAERSWRAALLCFAYISYYTGQIIVYAVHEKWNQSHFARFHLMSALLATAVLFLSPESPVWLAWKGKHEKAFRILRRLFGNDTIAQEKIAEMTRNSDPADRIEPNEMESVWETCVQLPVLKPFILVCVFKLLGLIKCTFLHFTVSHDEWITSNDLTYKICAAVGFFLLLAFVSRRLLFMSLGVIAVINILIFGVYSQYSENESNIYFFVRTMVSLISSSLCTAFDIAALLILIEQLPGHARGAISSYMLAMYSLIVNIFHFIFTPTTQGANTLSVIFTPGVCMLASFTIISVILLIYVWLPETKGRTLMEIENICKTQGWFYKEQQTKIKARNIGNIENAI